MFTRRTNYVSFKYMTRSNPEVSGANYRVIAIFLTLLFTSIQQFLGPKSVTEQWPYKDQWGVCPSPGTSSMRSANCLPAATIYCAAAWDSQPLCYPTETQQLWLTQMRDSTLKPFWPMRKKESWNEKKRTVEMLDWATDDCMSHKWPRATPPLWLKLPFNSTFLRR